MRELLQSCGFDERGVAGRLEIDGIPSFKSIRQGRRTALDIESPLDVLIRLFLDGEAVEDAVARALLPERGIESLAALNLLIRDVTRDAPSWVSTVLIYPEFGLSMISERPDEGRRQSRLLIMSHEANT